MLSDERQQQDNFVPESPVGEFFFVWVKTSEAVHELLVVYKGVDYLPTIEAIGKYQLISSPPINHYTIVPITHIDLSLD